MGSARACVTNNEKLTDFKVVFLEEIEELVPEYVLD